MEGWEYISFSLLLTPFQICSHFCFLFLMFIHSWMALFVMFAYFFCFFFSDALEINMTSSMAMSKPPPRHFPSLLPRSPIGWGWGRCGAARRTLSQSGFDAIWTGNVHHSLCKKPRLQTSPSCVSSSIMSRSIFFIFIFFLRFFISTSAMKWNDEWLSVDFLTLGAGDKMPPCVRKLMRRVSKNGANCACRYFSAPVTE